MNPRVNVGSDCHLLGVLLSHSDKSSKKVEKRRFQVAQKEQEQKEQNLFKWSIPGKGTTQVNQVFSSAVQNIEEQIICCDVLTVWQT